MEELYYKAPAGWLKLTADSDEIRSLTFVNRPESNDTNEYPVLREAARQLDEYFGRRRMSFDLPLAPQGTDFEQSVWRELLKIPYGETRSYRQIAQQLGDAKKVRAVGRANGHNRIAIIIPCHRVIGSNGHLTGFAGGLEWKRQLLQLEGALLI
jgi:methylated-DNA-[protein]-cysteine S-methyltransferase